MPHFWQLDAHVQWTALELFQPQYELAAHGLIESPADSFASSPSDLACLRRVQHGDGDSWVLLAARNHDVCLNGDPLTLGIAVLKDKDCIQACGDDANGGRFYFSTERLARIEPFRATAKTACPRCKQAIEPGQDAVRCPQCGVWHHQLTGKDCWTYAPRCAACQNQPTPLETGFRWTPESL